MKLSLARLKAVILPICVVMVLLSSSAITAFASEDYIQVNGTDIGGTFYFEDATLTQFAGTNEIIVPLYYTMFINNVTYNDYQYISGFFRCNDPLTATGVSFPTNTSIVFEPLYETLRANNRGNVLRLFFDNYHPVPDGQQILLGYYHIFLPSVTTNTNYSLGSSSQLIAGVANAFLRITDYEYGYITAVVNAIESSSSIDHLESILLDIEDDTNSIYSVMNALRLDNSALYDLVDNIYGDMPTDDQIDAISDDTAAIKTKLNAIFNLLNENFNQQTSNAASQAAEIGTKVADLSDDMAVTKPSGVANVYNNALSNIESQYDTSHNSSIFGWLGNSAVILMMSLVIGFSILSYMLYGGK